MTGPTVDQDVLAGLRELQEVGEPDFFSELITIFLEEAPRGYARIFEAIEARDAQALEGAAHGLKGASMNLGATGMGNLCEELETLGRSGTTVGSAETARELRAELERVEAHFSTLLAGTSNRA